MKVPFTCLVDMEKNEAIMKTEKELLAKSNAELLSFATRKGAKSARTEGSSLKLALSCIWNLLFMLTERMYRIVAKKYLRLLLLR